ncbi:hypothetical protein U1Q18_027269 [Sarracenia purpurea var. burkii]
MTSLAALSSLSFPSPSNPLSKTPPPQFTLSLSSSPSPSSLTLPPSSSPSLQFRDRLIPITPQKQSFRLSQFSDDLLSVVCPSLVFANIVFFKSGYNVQVIVGENEPEEKLINRFRRDVLRAGVIQECKRRRFFESKQDEKKRKAREAAKRNRRRRPQPKAPTVDKQGASKKKGCNEENDNWDFVDGELPYC